MKNKVIKFFLLLSIVSFVFVSCSNGNTPKENKPNISEENTDKDSDKENNNPVEEEDTTSQEPTIFNALGKSYSSQKDLKDVSVNTDICDDFYGNHYTIGDYKELDFAQDILYAYVNQEEYVYDYLISHDSTNENGYIKITQEDKQKLQKDLSSLRSQMGLTDNEEMTLKLDKVTYLGKTKAGNGESFKVRVAIARVGATLVPWNYFEVEVYADGENLLAYIF